MNRRIRLVTGRESGMGSRWLAVLLALSCAVGSARSEEAATKEAPTGDASKRDLPTVINVADLVKRVKDSVVVVSFAGRDGKTEGVGTGFIIRADGMIATNNHVIGEARPITVRTLAGKSYPVESIVAHERSLDLPILKIAAEGLPALELGDSDTLVQGQPVVAIGNPEGLEHSVVTGVVSGLRKEVDGRSMIQLAIPIERGNSGGPLIDLEGRVHGLLTLKSLVTENLGYAVPVNELKPLLEKPSPISMARWMTIGRLSAAQWDAPADVNWSQRAGQIKASGIPPGFGGRSLCLSKVETPKVPYEVAVAVRMEEEEGAAGLVFFHDGERHYGFYPSSGKLRFSRFDGPVVYDWNVIWDEPVATYKAGEWNSLKVRIETDRIVCFCNGEQVFEFRGESPGKKEQTDDEKSPFKWHDGRAGLAKFRHTTAHFKGFSVADKIVDERPDAAVVGKLQELTKEIQADRPPTADQVASAAALTGGSRIPLEQEAVRLQRQAERIRQLASAVHEARVQKDLATALDSDDPNAMLRAALLVSALDNPELDVDYYVKTIEELAAELKPRVDAAKSPDDKLAELHKFLFDEQSFHGSRVNYDSASNSYLNEVIDDREGLPITLSVVYISIANRVGLKAEGVGLPGHYVVRYVPPEGSGEPKLIDVFDRGKILPLEEAKLRVTGGRAGEWDDEYLAAQAPKQIVERMFRNLIGVANRKRDPAAALRYVEGILAFRPDSGQDQIMKAILCYNLGRYEDGLKAADWVLAHPPEGVAIARVEELRAALAGKAEKSP